MIDDVQNLIVGSEGSAVTPKCHSQGATQDATDAPSRQSYFLTATPHGIQNMLTFRACFGAASASSPRGYIYSITLLRGHWAQSDSLMHQTDAACDRVRALQVEHVEAKKKKMINVLLMELKARQVPLVNARCSLEQMCHSASPPLKQTHKYGDINDYFDDPATETNVDAATFTRLGDDTKVEIWNVRAKAAGLLDDVLHMSEIALFAFKDCNIVNVEQAQKIWTAEARNQHQSETISQLKERLVVSQTKKTYALRETDALTASLKVLEKDHSELEADKNEKSIELVALVDLKDELAKTLQQKRVIDSDRGGLTARTSSLQTQLREAEALASQRTETISGVQDKLTERDAYYTLRMATLELDKAALSSDLSELRKVYGKTRV